MLKFIGTGSAFNYHLGNNSAYFKIDNDETMYLIDCGGSVFGRIMELNLLEGVKRLVVMVTHTHPDHIGSLGDLIFYTYFIKGFKTELCTTNITPLYATLNNILNNMGVSLDYYDNYKSHENVWFDWQINTHVKEIPSFSFCMTVDGKTIYYSGDCNNIHNEIIELLEEGTINYFYQDTCGIDYPGNVHLYYGNLCKLIKPEYRHKVCCMHLDSKFNTNQAVADGFAVAFNETLKDG